MWKMGGRGSCVGDGQRRDPPGVCAAAARSPRWLMRRAPPPHPPPHPTHTQTLGCHHAAGRRDERQEEEPGGIPRVRARAGEQCGQAGRVCGPAGGVRILTMTMMTMRWREACPVAAAAAACGGGPRAAGCLPPPHTRRQTRPAPPPPRLAGATWHQVGALMPEYDPVTKISIVPRGAAGGLTFFAPSEERLESGLYSRSYLENQMAVALGGRVAEELIFGPDNVTTGASGALMTLLGSLVNPGDEWLMPDPCYPCNRHMVSLFGGLPRLIPTSAQSQFQLSAATVREHWRPHTRGVLLASPSNPTGTRIAPDELRAVHAEVRANGGVLIVDEIYLGLTYGARRDSALALGEDVFVVSSFSKYFAMTGWRLGWLVAPPDAMRGLERFAQNATICPPALAQHAALAAFEPASLAICEARREEFQARRDDLIPALQGIGFKVPTLPDGAFYVYADCSALATDSARLARELLEAAGVALTPGDDFGVHEPQRWLRFAYTCDRTLLRQAVARLKEALPHIKCAVGAA